MPFNDLAAVERALAEHPEQVAGMILEPMMMNAGIIHPVDGYLAGLKELLHRHGALLTFDEVKTGLTVGPGGVTGWSGVTPDLVCLAKAIGGGVSTAAIGGSEQVMSLIADGGYEQVGTFNGNPLAMAVGPGDADRGAHPRGVRAPRRAARPDGHRAAGRHRPARAALARGHRRREGLRVVPARTRSATSATSSGWTAATATRTGWCSTTAAPSCRRGARSSSG